MLAAIGGLTALGVTLGTVLAVASRCLNLDDDPLEADLEALLPGAQCGQCGHVGCKQAAAALAAGTAPVTLCPPGGASLVRALADRLGIEPDCSEPSGSLRLHEAVIDEDDCVGCMKCLQACASDAIVGAPKQLHGVLAEACMGCGRCVEACPNGAIALRPMPVTLETWHWPKPARV